MLNKIKGAGNKSQKLKTKQNNVALQNENENIGCRNGIIIQSPLRWIKVRTSLNIIVNFFLSLCDV